MRPTGAKKRMGRYSCIRVFYARGGMLPALRYCEPLRLAEGLDFYMVGITLPPETER